MKYYHAKPEEFNIITELLQKVQTTVFDDLCVLIEYPDYLLFQGGTEKKYNESNYQNLNIPVSKNLWTGGGIGIFSPGAIVIGAVSSDKNVVTSLRDSIYGLIKPLCIERKLEYDINNNDILINHQKLSGVFIDETAQKQYVMGLYINNKAPNNLIKEVTNNYQRMGVGLEELNISSAEVIKKIEELFEDKIDEIKRP